MKKNNNILKQLLDSTIELTSDLLDMGYSLQESFMYALKFMNNERLNQHMSAEDYVEVEGKYMQKVFAFV